MNLCKTYSDATLENIIRQLARSGDWPQRLFAARAELARRKAGLRR